MEAAINAGEREQAEGARLSAYAFFEFGPERLLRGLDPQLTTEIEGYVWYGAEGKSGLAELIADDGSARDVRDTRLALDEALEQAKGTTGEGASGITVITNAALIVFREGLEAILIIAAITASMVGSNRRLRKPILRGALLGLPASAVLFGIAVLLLDQLSQYGEKLEAVVGLVAIAILLLVLNWFFHKVYWTEWIASHRKRSKALAGAAAGGVAAGATVFGLYMLGFTSVFREGFETVLFLQALQLESGTGIVLAGVGLGLLGVAAVGAVTFKLEQKLPYKKMLIVTGVLISLVLGRDGRQHDAHAAGCRLDLDHADRLRLAAVDGHLARHLPDVGDDRRAGRGPRLRDRQLLRGRVGAQAQRAQGDREGGGAVPRRSPRASRCAANGGGNGNGNGRANGNGSTGPAESTSARPRSASAAGARASLIGERRG